MEPGSGSKSDISAVHRCVAEGEGCPAVAPHECAVPLQTAAQPPAASLAGRREIQENRMKP